MKICGRVCGRVNLSATVRVNLPGDTSGTVGTRGNTSMAPWERPHRQREMAAIVAVILLTFLLWMARTVPGLFGI